MFDAAAGEHSGREIYAFFLYLIQGQFGRGILEVINV
jgi:hypothetical protein